MSNPLHDQRFARLLAAKLPTNSSRLCVEHRCGILMTPDYRYAESSARPTPLQEHLTAQAIQAAINCPPQRRGCQVQFQYGDVSGDPAMWIAVRYILDGLPPGAPDPRIPPETLERLILIAAARCLDPELPRVPDP